MKIIISEVIGSKTAAFREEGNLVYALLEEYMNSERPFELSFENLETCSTLFLNTSIGKLYRKFPQSQIESQMKITNISHDDRIMRDVIERSIWKALNSETYNQILKEAYEFA